MSVEQCPIIAFDVDLCVVDLTYQWYEYLRRCVKDVSFTYDDIKTNYNFQEPISKYITREEAFYFWKQENLYDKATPLPGVVECVNRLKRELNAMIIFVSHVEGNHAKSKFEFLKRNFPVDGFMATREKQFARADIAIDDRLENLICHPDHVKTVLFETEQAQTLLTPFEPDCKIAAWNDEAFDKIASLLNR